MFKLSRNRLEMALYLVLTALSAFSFVSSLSDLSVPRWCVGFFAFSTAWFLGLMAVRCVLNDWGRTLKSYREYVEYIDNMMGELKQ